jgi:hypothetical protein
MFWNYMEHLSFYLNRSYKRFITNKKCWANPTLTTIRSLNYNNKQTTRRKKPIRRQKSKNTKISWKTYPHHVFLVIHTQMTTCASIPTLLKSGPLARAAASSSAATLGIWCVPKLPVAIYCAQHAKCAPATTFCARCWL